MDRSEDLRRQDDSTLVGRCLREDQEAWRELIHRYRRLMYSVPLRLGLSEEEAADVFQGVCVTLVQKLHTVRDIPRLSSWLITTAQRECQRVIRNRPRELSVGDNALAHDLELDLDFPESERTRLEEQTLIRRGVDELPERSRSLIEALYFERPHPSYQEIQERLDIPLGGIGPTRARALEKLRSILERHGLR